jgi:hypothetical protein
MDRKNVQRDIRILQRDVAAAPLGSRTRQEIDSALRSAGMTPPRHATDSENTPRPAAPAPATSTSRAPATTPSRPRGR